MFGSTINIKDQIFDSGAITFLFVIILKEAAIIPLPKEEVTPM